MLTLLLRPHMEAGGFHTDRFDAYLDGELIVTTRSPLYNGARKLLELGHDPDVLMTIRHEGKDYDSFLPRPIGELAKWQIAEEKKAGLRRQPWLPPTVGSAKQRDDSEPYDDASEPVVAQRSAHIPVSSTVHAA